MFVHLMFWESILWSSTCALVVVSMLILLLHCFGSDGFQDVCLFHSFSTRGPPVVLHTDLNLWRGVWEVPIQKPIKTLQIRWYSGKMLVRTIYSSWFRNLKIPSCDWYHDFEPQFNDTGLPFPQDEWCQCPTKKILDVWWKKVQRRCWGGIMGEGPSRIGKHPVQTSSVGVV